MEAITLPLLALVGGLVSFSSPCCLPLLPGYLSYVSALPVGELGERQARAVTFRAALLFVLGFTTVFTLLGLGASFVGAALLREPWVVRGFGLVIIALGIATLGVVRVPLLYRERRMDLARVPRGPAWAFPLGMAFAAGWVPCIGPILATILTTAAVAGSALWGALLLVFYSLGLGLPFIALALGFRRMQRSMAWLRRNSRKVELVGGTLLIAVGLLFVTDQWQTLFRPLQRWMAELGWPPI